MDEFVVVVFPDEAKAYDGVRRLRRLHAEGSVSLYGFTVIRKEAPGAIKTLEARDDQPPVGIAVGSLVGVLVGVLGGPVGAALGLSGGALIGLVQDAREIDVSDEFLHQVERELKPGHYAVVAELAETWVTPVDVEMDAAGGIVIRQMRLVFEEEQAEREAAARRAELQRLREEWARAASDRRAKLDQRIDQARSDLEAAVRQLETRATQVKDELTRKIDALNAQLVNAEAGAEADIKRRITELNDELTRRADRMDQSIALAREALAPSPSAKSETLAAVH